MFVREDKGTEIELNVNQKQVCEKLNFGFWTVPTHALPRRLTEAALFFMMKKRHTLFRGESVNTSCCEVKCASTTNRYYMGTTSRW